MPDTPLGFITPGMRFIAWERAPVDVMRARAALRDPQRDPAHLGRRVDERRRDRPRASRASRRRRAPRRSLVGLVYSDQPRAHRRLLRRRARAAIAASADVDVLNLKDPGGLLTPERVRTLVPALRAAAPALPLEVHSHCTATMAPLVYLEAARLGASFVCTAVRPLANGTSQPSAEQTIANLRDRGLRRSSIDEDALARDVGVLHGARRAGSDVRSACRVEYDVSIYAHQLPGGMTSTLRRQLREVGLEDRWEEVLDELPARARGARLADHGHAALAVRRRAGVPERDDRRALVADPRRGREVRARPVRPAAGRARSRTSQATVLASPQGRAVPRTRSTASTSRDARARYGDAISDELLLLRMMLPAEQVDAMLARPRGGDARGRRGTPSSRSSRASRERPLREIELTAPGRARCARDEPARRHRRGRLRRRRDAAARERPERRAAARIRSPARSRPSSASARAAGACSSSRTAPGRPPAAATRPISARSGSRSPTRSS